MIVIADSGKKFDNKKNKKIDKEKLKKWVERAGVVIGLIGTLGAISFNIDSCSFINIKKSTNVINSPQPSINTAPSPRSDVSDADKKTPIMSSNIKDRGETYTMALKKSNTNKIKMDNFVSVAEDIRPGSLVLGTTGTTTVDDGTWDESAKILTYTYKWNGVLSYHANWSKETNKDNLNKLNFRKEKKYFLAVKIPTMQIMGADYLGLGENIFFEFRFS